MGEEYDLFCADQHAFYSYMSLKGSTPSFLAILVKIIFFADKVSSGMWAMCPKILGGYDF